MATEVSVHGVTKTNKGMLKSEKTRCNLKDSHRESEIVTMHVIFAPYRIPAEVRPPCE